MNSILKTGYYLVYPYKKDITQDYIKRLFVNFLKLIYNLT